MVTALTLPRGSRVLVTGANGFIASHTINQLLKLGYRVRGTVRAPKPWLDVHFADRYGWGMFETAHVRNFGDLQEIESALDGVDGVIHLVSDVTMGDDIRKVAPWACKATVTMLEAASRWPSIRSVVMGSSSTAAYSPEPGKPGVRIEEGTWNMAAVRKAWAMAPSTPDEIASGTQTDWNNLAMPDSPSLSHSHTRLARMLMVYSACKTQCEWEAWRWVRHNRPGFKFNTVIPAYTVGRVLHSYIPGSTMGWVRSLLHGNTTPMALIPPKWFVDVEDVARLFTIALLDSTVRSERVFAFGESVNWTEVIGILRQLEPENPRIPNAREGELRDHAEIVPRARALDLLRQHYNQMGMTPIVTSITRCLLEGSPATRLQAGAEPCVKSAMH